MIRPKFRSQRRSSKVKRWAEEPLCKHCDELTVIFRRDGTEEFRDCHCGDDDDFFLLFQIAKQNSGAPPHLYVVIARVCLLRVSPGQPPDQHHRIKCNAQLSPETSFK